MPNALNLTLTLTLTLAPNPNPNPTPNPNHPNASRAQRLTPVVYMPEEVVLKQGLKGSSMYFIELGMVSVVIGRDRLTIREVRASPLYDVTAICCVCVCNRLQSVCVCNRLRLTIREVSASPLYDVTAIYCVCV